MATYIDPTSLDAEKPTDLLPEPAGFSARLPDIPLAPEPSLPEAVKPVAPAVNLAPTPKVAPTDTQVDAQDRYDKVQKQIEQSVYDPENFYKGKDLSFDDDPKRAKALTQNDLYIDSRNAVDIDAGSMERDVQRKRIAYEDFDGRGADDEMAFNAEVNKKYQDKRSTEELNNKIVEHAFNSAIIAPGEADNENQTMEDYLEGVKTQPGYNKKKEASYVLAYKQAQALGRSSVEPFRKELNQMINSAKVGADPLDLSFEVYDKLKPQDRARFEDALVIRARALNPAERKGFFANMGRRYGETFFDFGTQMSGGLEMVAGAVAADEDPSSPEALKLRKSREFYRRIKTKLREDYNPIQSAFGGNAQDFRDPSTFSPMWWEKMAYEMPGVAGTSLIMAVPVVGFPAMALAMTGQAQEAMMDRLVEQGMSEDKAIEISNGLAPLIMIPQMAAEYVGYKLLFGKLPFFKKALDKMGDRITNVFLRFGSKALAIGAAETGIELLQDATNFAIQDIANALDKDTYGVQWLDEGTKKGVLAPLLGTSPEIFVTMLPLTLLGTVNNLSIENRNKTFRATPRIYREAAGITDIDNAQIESAPGPNSLNTAIENARKNMDGNSLKAIQAKEFLETELALAKQISRDMDALGIFKPRFTFDNGKISIFDETDFFLGDADNIPAAVAIAREHTLALDDLTDNSMSLLASQLQGARLAQKLDPASTLNYNFGEDFNPAYATAEQIARYALQKAMRTAAGLETGEMANSVLGYSKDTVDEFGERKTVNDIFQKGSIFTSFHETGHGLRNDALAKGRITREDEIRIMRAFDALSFNADGSPKARGSQKVMFIPVGVADADVTEAMREEAVSELFEVEILRFKGDGSYNRFGVSKATVSRNLAAIAKQYPGPASRFAALLSHFKGRWGVALLRVARLNKGVRDGEFDIADYEQFLDKIMGVSEQVQFDAEVQTDQAEMLDADPFSIGYVPDNYAPNTDEETKAFDRAVSNKRSGELAVAAVRMVNGQIMVEDYADAVDFFDGFKVKGSETIPTEQQLRTYLSAPKDTKKGNLVGEVIPNGTMIDGRIDINGYNASVRAGESVHPITLHEPTSEESADTGTVLSYVGIAKILNPFFNTRLNNKKAGAAQIASGSGKFRLATVTGVYEAISEVPSDISDTNVYTEVSFNPVRSSYFVDVVTKQSVVSGSEAIMVGSRVFVKDAVLKPRPTGIYNSLSGFSLGDVTPDMLAMKAPAGITPVLTGSLPMWQIPKVDGESISTQKITNKNRDEFFGRLDAALANLAASPELIGTAEGWVNFLREAGVSGTVPMPPSGVVRMLTDPKGFIADMSGGYHGARTVPNVKQSADDGLASVRKMRKAIGKGKAPNLMVSVLTSLWGINSRSQPPIDQEAMWLRLVSDQRILDELKLSIDGNFTLNSTQWTRLVEEVRRDSMWESGTLGNGSTTNSNAFHMMLEKYNGKWDRYTATYAAADASTMNRGFWTLLGETGPVGIKNKVQRFIGLTFGIPGVVLDRWQYVQFWLPTLMEARGVTNVQDYWQYDKNGTAEDPLGIYADYGGADANQLLSMAMAEAIDLVMNKAIQNSPELQAYLGAAADAGGLHWHSWNAIKNEAVGHSSLDLTYDLQKKFKDKEIKPADVLAMFAKNEYFTSNNESEIRITRGQITSRITETKGKDLAGKIAVLEATRIKNIAKAGFSLSDGQFERSVAGVYGRGVGGITTGSDARFFPGDVGELNAVGPGAFPLAYSNAPDSLMGFAKNQGNQKGYDQQKGYRHEITVRLVDPEGKIPPSIDGMRGLNHAHAMERARRNWKSFDVEFVSGGDLGAFSIDAFHGTPNEIKGRMRLEFAGTGSGRMTYGYGLYVAGDKAESEIYATQVTGERMSTAKELAQRALRSEINQEQAIKSIRAADVPGMVEENRALIDEAVALILENKVDKSGNLYTIKLNVNDEDLLDYDKEFSQQSDKVKALLLPFIEARREFLPPGFQIDAIKGQGMISLMEREPQQRAGMMKLFHGSATKGFTEFKPQRDITGSLRNQGVHVFSTSRAVSEKYAGAAGEVREFWISAKNIFDFRNAEQVSLVVNKIKSENPELFDLLNLRTGLAFDETIADIKNPVERLNAFASSGDYSFQETQGMPKFLMEIGYDGYVNKEGDGLTYGIFDPSLIKLVEDDARYDEQRSSRNLKNAGIPGMRFIVDGRLGVYNYVIFDESVIEITEKNGVPVTLISPASTNSFSLGKPFYASTNVHGLRVDKTAWADAGSSMEGAREIVSKYYKTAKFAGIDKDSILIPVPSTLGKNVLPDALAERLAVDFGNAVEKRVVGVAQSRTEAKKKLSFFAKEQDAVVFAPTAATAELRGKKVTITEDVHNTGESWIAFANMLIEAGADVVGVATLASSEQRMTSPRDIQRLSGKVAAFSGESLDVVEPLMDAMFDGTFKQLFNKAEAVATRSSKSAIELLALARKGDRGNRFKNPLRSVGESEDGLLGDEQKSFAFSIGVEVPLANALVKMVGEEAFEYRQDGMTIDEKKEQVQNLAFSLTHDDLGLPLVPGTEIAIIKQKLATTLTLNDLKIPFLGDKILGYGDFAVKMQVLRNPAFETFYCVAMQGDNSIAAYAVTSRIPHSAAVGMSQSIDDNIYDLRLFLKAHAADGYYLAHNHPSGVPTPSQDDMILTGYFVAQLGEFEHKGHVIINHDKFAVIRNRNTPGPIIGTKVGNGLAISTADLPDLDYTVYDFTSAQADQFAGSPESGIGKPLQSFYYPYGTTPDAYNGGLATQIKKVVTDIQNPDMIMGIVTNIRLNVVAYLSGTIDDFASITSKQLQDYGSKQGGTKLFLHAKETSVNTREALDKAFVPMLATGMIGDLMVENSSGTQLTSLRREFELMGKDMPDDSFYGKNEARDAKPILVQNGFSIGTMFSGGRVVEGGFAKPRVSSFAREYDPTINDFANESFDTSFVAGNVEDFDFDEIALDPPLLVSASPPCPNFSKAGRKIGATVNDMNCAKAVARMIKSVFPFAVTIENVPDYRGTEPYKLIVDALDKAGYTYEVLNIDAADYGAAQRRKRLLIRAVREGKLPAVPAKSAPGDWYPLIEDLIADAEETTMPQDERMRLDNMIAKGQIDPNLPILSQGTSAFAGTLLAVNSGQPSNTILAGNAKPRIYLPDGTAKSVTTRMMARIMGLPDTFKLPSSFYLAKRILGNGIHSVVASQFIEPLMDLPQATQFPTYNPKFKVDTSRDAEAEQKVASMQGTFGFQLSDFEIPEILSEDAMSRTGDPKRRTQMMTSIATAFNNLQLTFDRISLLSKRKETQYELKQAARAREELNAEMATEKIWANYGDLFFNDDLTRLKAQPIHKLFADPDSPMRGLLKSPSAWRRGRRNSARSSLVLPPEFNGSDNVSRSVFGGERMPDQAAKEAYEAGLIKGNTFDFLWDGLVQEQNTVYAMRESLKKAQQQIREAKAEAKKEANEWLKTSLANQSEVFNPRVEIIRALRMYEAIRSALPVEIRGELGGMVALASMTSNEKKLAFLQEKLSKADVLLERYLRIQFNKEWLELLKRAKPRADAAGEVPTGKIAANSYEVFRVAESAMGLSFADGIKLADAHEAMADDPDTSMADKIMHRAISGMVSLTTNWVAASAATREQAVVDGIKILDGGLQALNIKLSKRREYLDNLAKVGMAGMRLQGDFMGREAKRIAITGPGVGKTLEKAKLLAWELMSYGEVVSSIFGKDNQLTKWLRALELKASNDYEDAFQLKAGELEALFNRLAGSQYKGQQLRYKMVNDKTIKFVDQLGKNIEFTESQAVTYLLMERQEDGKRHLGGITDNQGNILSNWSYGDEQTADIRAQISNEALELLLFLGDNYGAEYERINDVFMEIRHIRMPRHKLYAPIDVSAQNQSYGQGLIDPTSGMPLQGAGHPGSFKNRSSTAIAEPNFGDAIDLYMSHVRQMEHFISHAEFSRDAMAVLGKKEVRDAIIANAGADAFNVLNKYIQYFAAGGVMNASAGLPMARTLGVQLGNMAGASLVGSVSVLAMQSLQAGAALYKMPVSAYLKRLALVTMGRLEYGSALRSEYIQRRLSLLPFVVRDAMNNLSSGKPNLIKYWSTQLARTIGAADALFTATTYAILYDYHFMLAQQSGSTSPELQATRMAEKIADEIAQPMRVGAKSWLEVGNSGNPAFRLLFNFASAPRQMLGIITAEAMDSETNKAEKIATVGKALAITWGVSGILMTILRTMMRDLRDDGEDKEVFDEKNWDLGAMMAMAATGPIGGLPFFGDVLESAIYGVAEEYRPNEGLLAGAVAGITKVGNRWTDGNFELLKDAEALLLGAAPFSATAAASKAFVKVAKDAIQIVENITSGISFD